MAKKEKSQAAQKVAQAEKKQNTQKKQKAKNPNGNIFVRMGKRIKRFFKDFRGEIKKIIWPDGRSVLKNTGVVLVVVIAVAIPIYLVDQGLAFGIDGLEWLVGWIKNKTAQDPEATTEAMMRVFSLFQ